MSVSTQIFKFQAQTEGGNFTITVCIRHTVPVPDRVSRQIPPVST